MIPYVTIIVWGVVALLLQRWFVRSTTWNRAERVIISLVLSFGITLAVFLLLFGATD